jgi:hypothetical protein
LAAACLALPATAATKTAVVKKRAKQVREVVAARRPATAAEGVGSKTLQFIIFAPFSVVRQDRVRLADVFETPFGGRVVRVCIRMVFAGQFAVRLFDFGSCGCFGHAKRAIEIFL